MHLNFNHLFQKIKKPFQQGLSGIAITNAIIVSLLFTVFPVFGVTTLLLTYVAIKFKLNLPIMILISYLAAPLIFLTFHSYWRNNYKYKTYFTNCSGD